MNRADRLLPATLLFSAILGACTSGVEGAATCEWRLQEGASQLDLRNQRHRRHLNHDAIVAEDVAIRYADLHRGHRSGHFAGMEAYRQSREQCMALLFDAVARTHGVAPMEVRGALGYRRTDVDAIVILAFVAFYAGAADAIIRWMRRSLSVDAWSARLVATLIASIVVGAGAVVLFGLWTATVDMIRVGNTHMSYRADRNPWSQHQAELFLGGIVLFALVAAVRHWSDIRHADHSEPTPTGQAIEHRRPGTHRCV